MCVLRCVLQQQSHMQVGIGNDAHRNMSTRNTTYSGSVTTLFIHIHTCATWHISNVRTHTLIPILRWNAWRSLKAATLIILFKWDGTILKWKKKREHTAFHRITFMHHTNPGTNSPTSKTLIHSLRQNVFFFGRPKPKPNKSTRFSGKMNEIDSFFVVDRTKWKTFVNYLVCFRWQSSW